ncbi:MAG: hypothetical protein WCO83_02260 [Alphaproteobacteria bacterium]
MTKLNGGPKINLDLAEATLAVVHECLEDGFPMEPNGPKATAISEAARRLEISPPTLKNRLQSTERQFGLTVDKSRFTPKRAFTVDPLPHDGEPDAEELIRQLTERHAKRKTHEEAAKLQHVRVNTEGPVAVAFFGDPHVDDPGCAWGDLERDICICRDTPGFMAVNIGDTTNNWVGRLMGLYANQEVTSKQALTLIEWVLTQLPWLVTVGGNHDTWNTQKGDVSEVIHRLQKMPGLYQNVGARMAVHLPSGASFTMNVRHDFPGGSQFNPAHALVRETLFNHRDHILACGHRHTSGYIPIWHNDPARLCHGFRVGTYKDFDHYAKEKGFKESNWARSMAAVIDPAHADDPVRFIKPFFSLEEAAEYLTYLRRRAA